MTPDVSTSLQQFLHSLPNPSKIKEVWIDVTWHQPSGDPTHTAIFIVALLVLAIVVIALCITVYHLKRR